ncbi:uncharacterized protein LOC133879154 [Alnus glutinosa]|uniref:uncharacterized protein LOC133879154 n=1 Tax=Alnus glutinosa TaxID=3517 RepID=UPI002D775D9D|nr:uncharacterized protein LOC133879154 [Alnus glutinosa]
MAEEDQEKTSFITDRGLYCYKVMPFELKNAGATYQRLVNKMFEKQMGRNVEVYVDDMLVKSVKALDHVSDLRETFDTIRRYRMRLNPAKCAFGVSSGKFLGYLVSQRGIEANPEKVRAVLEMQPPRTTKQLQQLTGRIADLNRFISRSTDKCLPFFRILKKAFVWDSKCEEAFGNLKEYLMNPPLLSRPVEGEVLYMYLAVSSSAVSSALVWEEKGIQKPVYFTSRALRGTEERYPRIEKLAFALIVSARKLRPYFQAHAIRVLTKYPLKKALADFFLEFCNTPEPRDPAQHPLWVVYVDGSSQCQRSGVGVILKSPQKQKFQYAIKLDFATTNNEVEYEAVLAGLAIAREVGALNFEIRSDSQVVVGQISGEFAAQGDRLAKYLEKVHDLQSSFRTLTVIKIPRERNVQADALARAGSATDQEIAKMKRQVLVQPNPSIDKSQCVLQVAREREPEPEWASDVIRYLRSGKLPSHKEQAHKVKLQAARYMMVDDMLYRRGYSHPLLKCLSAPEANYVLREIHEGVCGNHSGGRMLAIKAVRAGYYWPMMTRDSMEFVRSCDKCQRFARVMKNPPERLTSVLSPWPFSKWGVGLGRSDAMREREKEVLGGGRRLLHKVGGS